MNFEKMTKRYRGKAAAANFYKNISFWVGEIWDCVLFNTEFLYVISHRERSLSFLMNNSLSKKEVFQYLTETGNVSQFHVEFDGDVVTHETYNFSCVAVGEGFSEKFKGNFKEFRERYAHTVKVQEVKIIE